MIISVCLLLLNYLVSISFIEAYSPSVPGCSHKVRWILQSNNNKRHEQQASRCGAAHSTTIRRSSTTKSTDDTTDNDDKDDEKGYDYIIDGSSEISRRQVIEKIKTTATTSIASTTAAFVVSSRSAPAEAIGTVTEVASNGSGSSNSNSKTIIVPTKQLGKSTVSVSQTIQGYWQLAGGHGKYRESDAIQNMVQHYQSGITTLDTADIYGPSEIIIGKFISQQQQQQAQQLLKDDRNDSSSSSISTISNTNVIVPMTKFCCFRYLEEIDRNEVRQRILKSCERLQVRQLPLVQFFWSRYDVKRYVDVALFLTELKEEGLIQEIGATNFDVLHLQEMKKAGVPIVSHQVQLSALDRRPVQSGMATWCAENDISLIGFGTVGSGILSDRWLGRNAPTAEEKTTASLRMYSSTASRFGDWSLVQELLQTMDRIAKNVRSDGRCALANISNIAQRYVLQTPSVAAVLIGVRNTDHLQENLRTHTFQLNQSEIEAIDAVVAKRNGPTGDVWEIERGSM